MHEATGKEPGFKRYRIHRFVDVLVDPDVAADVRDTIEFQIGYFEGHEPGGPAAARIHIRPYRKRTGSFPEGTGQIFHQVRGSSGHFYDDPAARVAFVRESEGLVIFADSAEFLINLFIQHSWLSQGLSFVHAAGYAEPSGAVTLLAGAGGVGKTALLGAVLRRPGFRLLGDDLVGLDERGACWAFPRAFVLKAYHRSTYPEFFGAGVSGAAVGRKLRAGVRRLLGHVRENAPLVGLGKAVFRRMGRLDQASRWIRRTTGRGELMTVPVEQIFGEGCVADSGPLRRLVFLERHAGSKFHLEAADPDVLAPRLFSIIHHEWVDFMRQWFALGALDLVEPAPCFERTAGILRAGLDGAECHRLVIPEEAGAEELGRYFSKRFLS